MCSLETGGMDVQNLGPVEIQENVSSHTLYYRKDTMGFPYYLKVDLLCSFKESSWRVMLEDSMTGLAPKAVYIFQEPTHPTHFKPQRLEVELSIVSLSDHATCGSEMCKFSWYAPVPFINGSVVQRVKVKSIEMGSQHLPEKRCMGTGIKCSLCVWFGTRHQERSSLKLKFNGMTFNPSTGILYIWGNSLIFSYILTWEDEQNFWHDSGFPGDQMIKYFTLSYDGTFVFVTEQEELWWGQERTESVFRLRPSQGWNEFLRLQALSGDHSTLTVFYDGDKELQEVIGDPKESPISRICSGVLYKVTVTEKAMVEGQVFPGERLLLFSVMFRGLQNLPVYIGCPPGNRLVFDARTTLQESVRLNGRNFSCLNLDPVTPCFYYKNLFFPFFLIQDVVLGESRKFLGSYTFKIVGGGPHSRKNIHLYSPEEVLWYNSLNYRSKKARIWDIKSCETDRSSCNITEEGFLILNATRINGIRWLCQPKSPCGDVLSKNPVGSPRFFFIVEISNRDTETYCSHIFRFELIVYDLPMSTSRKCYIFLVSF
ncbi:cation channel sperm-associated subunit gamma [Labeo rohita]|uniref:Cation channel sperm-associated subunit gamma n=1 Tax=Labeo rohita TaxID=84645 RepID=A0A498LC62_LABRO|nr:cation channel sperm-associated subunit gamma [Labeo rohita]RXN05881.1 cation channel sperm-associated subunit gamma [Labeo rohita]